MKFLQSARRLAKRIGKGRLRFAARFEKQLFKFGLRSSVPAVLPDFLCIGAQKAGTTWLHENLKMHPEIFLPARKELHYFDWQYSRPISFYAKNFEGVAGKVIGDVTPGYGVIPTDRIEFIRSVMPGVKLLMLLRNPVDRAWSHAVMGLAFSQGRQVHEIGTEDFIAHFASQRSLALGMYTQLLARWETCFPRERFLVGFFEEISAAPRQLLTRVFEFLGVAANVDWNSFPVAQVIRPFDGAGMAAAEPAPEMPDACRKFLQDLYRDEIERLITRFGAPVRGWRC